MKKVNSNKKYLLIGIIVGIVTGAAAVYLAMRFGMIRPFGFGDFAGSGNFTNFTRPLRNAAGVP